MATTCPLWSKIMKRVLVVPWSSAPTYCAMSTLLSSVDLLVCLEHELGERQVVDDGREGAADERTDDRDPGVAPIGIPLAGDRQEEVGDPRTEVSGWVDRVHARSTGR